MSLVLAGRDSLAQAALPRGAGAIVLVLAILLHLAGGAAVFWAMQTEGAKDSGEAGLTVGLGPSGAASGALEAVEAEAVETSTSEAVPTLESEAETANVAPPRAPQVTPEAVPDVDPPPSPTEEVAPQSASVDSVELTENVDPVVAPSVSPAEPDEKTAQTDAATDTAPNRPPDAAPPDPVTATAPEEGLGVSLRPATRPESVEEAAPQAAAEADTRTQAARQQRRAAEADPDTEEPARERRAPAGQQGQRGASQNGTRGSGDGAAGGGSPGARADFAAIVAARLERAKQYPRSAQRARIEGTGMIWFRMNAAGQVTAARITRGTGHAVLDQAIMDTLRRASLPAIPDRVGRAQMEFSVPMAFFLR